MPYPDARRNFEPLGVGKTGDGRFSNEGGVDNRCSPHKGSDSVEIKIQCAWYHKDLGTKPYENCDDKNQDPLVSHSICSSCYQELESRKKITKGCTREEYYGQKTLCHRFAAAKSKQ